MRRVCARKWIHSSVTAPIILPRSSPMHSRVCLAKCERQFIVEIVRAENVGIASLVQPISMVIYCWNRNKCIAKCTTISFNRKQSCVSALLPRVDAEASDVMGNSKTIYSNRATIFQCIRLVFGSAQRMRIDNEPRIADRSNFHLAQFGQANGVPYTSR